jgi:hypothetical protein
MSPVGYPGYKPITPFGTPIRPKKPTPPSRKWQRVHIRAVTIPGQVICLLGPNGANLTGGYGNWEEVAIPRGTPFSQWTGRSLWAMDVDLMLDGWGEKKSIEPDITTLERFALRPGAQKHGQRPVTPPPVRLAGAIPHPEFTWVISGFDWGDALRSPATGRRQRQAVTLHLLEYQADETIAALAPAPPPPPRKYKVAKGDNLHKLAVRFLGKSSRWTEIVKLNKGMRGPQLGSRWVGKTILIPAY